MTKVAGVTIPESAADLEEWLHDEAKMVQVFQAGQLAAFNAAYATKMLEAKVADLVPQMREQMDLGWQQFAQANPVIKGFRPGDPGAAGNRHARRARAVANSRRRDAEEQVARQCLFNEGALGAQVDDEPAGDSVRSLLYTLYKAEHVAKTAGDGETVTRVQDLKRKLNKSLGRISNAGMAERLPAEGGFLVPEHLRSEILMVSLETSVVRPRATVIPMDSLRVPMPMIDDISHVNNVYGGVTAYWTEEGGTLSASAPSFGDFALQAKKLTAYTTIPNELLQDAITPLDRWFMLFFPKAMAWFEDIAFISGTGTGEPEGFLNTPAAIRQPVGTLNTVKWADIANMYARMWPASLNSAVWICAPDVLAQLLQLAVATNVSPPLFLQGFQAMGTPGGRDDTGYQYSLMGRPLIVSEKMPASTSGNTTTPGALSFVDLNYYLVGDRQAMQIATSEEYLFASDLVAYRVIQRLDGRLWLRSAITPENGGNTLSPVVKLDTTATS